MFVISPVDDTHHLLFFGTFGDTPHSAVPLDQIAMQAPEYVPDPAGLHRAARRPVERAGVRTARSWPTGISPASGGACWRRTPPSRRAWARSSTAARRTSPPATSPWPTPAGMLLDALGAAEAGELPPGSALTPEGVRLPNALGGAGGRGHALGRRHLRSGHGLNSPDTSTADPIGAGSRSTEPIPPPGRAAIDERSQGI